MRTGRIEALSDGVLAIVITIMVLELDVPTAAEWTALAAVWPTFLAYALSFVYVAIHWNNHHHLLAMSERRTPSVMWANMHLLFWLSLIPFTSGWLGQAGLAAPGPAALYGMVFLIAGAAYWILQDRILAAEPDGSALAREIGKDTKGKLSVALYAVAIALAFLMPLVSLLIYAGVALMWLVPDRRIERAYRANVQKAD